MRTHTKKIVALTVGFAVAGWFAGCNSSLEDETNVVLEVATITIPRSRRRPPRGVCTFTIPTSSATFNNKPKNHLAGAAVYPYNDIVLQNVTVGYQWDDGAALSVNRSVSVAPFPRVAARTRLLRLPMLRSWGRAAPAMATPRG